jgi:DNA-binding CsgD family transcriptional regulator
VEHSRSGDATEVCAAGWDSVAARAVSGVSTAVSTAPAGTAAEPAGSLAERKAAATRLLGTLGHWSDRTIGAATGLSPATVAAIRRRLPGPPAGQGARLGRDGRTRPLTATEGRRMAALLLRERPYASLREIARQAGISAGTVLDVRRRIARGEDPVPAPRAPHPATGGGTSRRAVPPAPRVGGQAPAARRDRDAILRSLCDDPSLRLTESGRRLLRWLLVRSAGPDGWEHVLETLPPHCGYLVAELADQCARYWSELAERLRRRSRDGARTTE